MQRIPGRLSASEAIDQAPSWPWQHVLPLPDEATVARRTDPAPFVERFLNQNAAYCTRQLKIACGVRITQLQGINLEQRREIVIPDILEVPARAIVPRDAALPLRIGCGADADGLQCLRARHVGQGKTLRGKPHVCPPCISQWTAIGAYTVIVRYARIGEERQFGTAWRITDVGNIRPNTLHHIRDDRSIELVVDFVFRRSEHGGLLQNFAPSAEHCQTGVELRAVKKVPDLSG